MAFLGEYQHSLDTKGRLIVPAKFRSQVGDKFIIVRWMEKSLRAMTEASWDELAKSLNNLPKGNKDARTLQRFVFSSATEFEIDKQGRIVLPANLRQHAQIDKDAILIGNGDVFEIWSQENWQHFKEDVEESIDELTDDLNFDF